MRIFVFSGSHLAISPVLFRLPVLSHTSILPYAPAPAKSHLPVLIVLSATSNTISLHVRAEDNHVDDMALATLAWPLLIRKKSKSKRTRGIAKSTRILGQLLSSSL